MKTNGIHWFPLCIPPTPGQNLPSAGFLFLFLASSECAARPRLSMRLLHLAMMSCANPRKSSYKGVNLKEKEKKSKDQQRDILFALLYYNAKNCHFSVLLRSLFQKKYKIFFRGVHYAIFIVHLLAYFATTTPTTPYTLF